MPRRSGAPSWIGSCICPRAGPRTASAATRPASPAAIRPREPNGKGYWLLARRSPTDPAELAYYLCYGPPATPLRELARVAGARWAIEETLCATRRLVVSPTQSGGTGGRFLGLM